MKFLFLFLVFTPIQNPQIDPPEESTGNVELVNKVENIEQSFEFIKESIFWSLSTVAFLAVLLVTYNWITAHQLLKSEIKIIREELENTLAKRLQDAEKKLSESTNAQEQHIQDIHGEINEKVDAIGQSLSKSIRSSEKSIKSEIEYDLNITRRKVFELDACYWEIRDVPANAITAWLNAAQYSKELEWDMSMQLDRLEANIKKFYQKQRSLDADTVNQLEQFLRSLGENYDLLRRRIFSLIES